MIAIVLGLMLATIVGEVALRVYVAGRGWTPNCYVTGLAFFVPHEQAGHTLRPDFRLRSSSYDVSTNLFGLRGPAISLEKPSGTYRVMVLGGSSVFGYLVPDGQDSCVELQSLLSNEQAFEGRQIEVLNAGVPGYNMTQCRLRYAADLAALKPDCVILYLGWNDSRTVISSSPETINRTPPAPSWWQRLMIRSVGYGLIRHRLLPSEAPQFAPPADSLTTITSEGMERFRADYQSLIEAVQASGASVLVSTQLMAGGDDCEDLDSFLGNTPSQIQTNREIGQSISEAVRDLAAVNQLPLVDVARVVPCNDELLGDAIHLTRRGHAEVARAWAEKLATIENASLKQP